LLLTVHTAFLLYVVLRGPVMVLAAFVNLAVCAPLLELLLLLLPGEKRSGSCQVLEGGPPELGG